MISSIRRVVALAKLRVVSLLVFTGICGCYASADGTPSVTALLAVTMGGTLAASGANAINQGLDADIDAVMARTRMRPVPALQMRPSTAIIVGAVLVIAGVVVMLFLTNWVASGLMFAAALTYVFVYTILLKRSSWNNIVIGGAAGAFPPLVGSAAVTGSIDTLGIYMFTFVFFWTPPHFWILSMLLRDDYREANVPMLASVASQESTALQVALYIVLLAALAWLPWTAGYGSVTFALVTTAISAEWLRRALILFRNPTRGQIVSAYKFSLVYLGIAFLVLAIASDK